MDDSLRKLAMQVLKKEDYQMFAGAYYDDNIFLATNICKEVRQNAVEELLSTVYNDECDFVLMDHYKKAQCLLDLMLEGGPHD
mgnify:FL=1